MDGGKRAREGDGSASASKRHAAVSEGALATLSKLWADAAEHRLRDVAAHKRAAPNVPAIELEVKCGITTADGSFLPNVGQERYNRVLDALRYTYTWFRCVTASRNALS